MGTIIVAVIQAAGLHINDFLANDGLSTGNPIIAGKPAVYDELLEICGFEEL